jgi:hypothetical protein
LFQGYCEGCKTEALPFWHHNETIGVAPGHYQRQKAERRGAEMQGNVSKNSSLRETGMKIAE